MDICAWKISRLASNYFQKNLIEYGQEGWSLKRETIKYCEADALSLFQIISKFGDEILQMFDFDISRSPTLPSLALGVYRSNFLKAEEYKIPTITGDTYSNLYQGYFGGHVDVYYPISDKDKKVFSYDVNSLYPSVMASNPMPIGSPSLL